MKEWLYRALRTFIQAITGFLGANLIGYFSGIDYSDGTAIKTVLISLGGSALAAGIAAVMNLKEGDTDNE